MRKVLSTMLLALAMGGCAVYAPRVPDAEPGIPGTWPIPADAAGDGIAADIGWREFITDDKLEHLVERALDGNRDLRVAVLNVERARSLYRIERSARVPAVGVTGALTRTGGDNVPVDELYTADIGALFELDLFGRVRNQSLAALERYFATEEAQRAAQLMLISDVIGAYLTYAADLELLRIAEATLATHQESYDLTEKRYELGAVSALDLGRARTVVETARADAARFAGQVARDANALALLVGGEIDASVLPRGFDEVVGLVPLPGGLPSEVLLRRPDIRAAEHRLRGANANVGAARAAFFPSISLTGAFGSASTELDGLFESGSYGWRVMPQVDIPLFQGGRLRGDLGAAKAERDIALAEYERAIQAGFRDVADALAQTRSLADQRTAQRALLESATRVYELSQARYDAGQDSYLSLLDAQRTLYAARQALVAVELAEQANRADLYRVLGGGWTD